MKPEHDQRAIDLGSEALWLAMRGKWKAACKKIQRVSDLCGPTGVYTLIMGLCDTLADRAGVAGQSVGLMFRGVEEDGTKAGITSAERTPGTVVWAGQVIGARCRLDRETFDALMEALPDDPAEIGRHVQMLLNVVASTLREHEAGGQVVFTRG